MKITFGQGWPSVCTFLTLVGLLQEKAKRGAWEKVHKEGIKPADAQKRYVQLVNDLKKKYGYAG